jgi:hypothetical protein
LVKIKEKIQCFWQDVNINDNSNTNNTNRKATSVTIMEHGEEKELCNEKDEKYMKMTTLLITGANNNDIILKYHHSHINA